MRRIPLPRAALALTMIVLAWSAVQWRIRGDDGQAWASIIHGDGTAYYGYFAPLFDPRGWAGVDDEYTTPAGDAQVIQHFAGTAVMQAPFVLIAHLRTLATGLPEDGRSLHYQLAVLIASLFWTWIGLWCVMRILATAGIADRWSALVLLIIVFGTGLGYYAVMAPGLSHVYSFAAIALFFRQVQRSAATARALPLSALLFGLVLLVRPVNGLVLLAAPLAVASATGWRSYVPTGISRTRVLRVLPLVLVGPAIQCMLWRLQCGEWLVWSYADEGFLFDRPAIWKNLFGAQKGLFFYWPLLLLLVPGAILLWRRSRATGISFLVYFIMLVYFTAAWWNWSYGDCYGMRPYLDHLAVLALPIAFVLQDGGRPLRYVALALVALLVPLQCFQAWQYRTGILASDNMDLEKYRFIFLGADDDLRGALGGHNEAPHYAPHGMEVIITSNEDDDPAHWTPGRYAAEFELPAPELPAGRLLFVKGSLEREERYPGSSASARIVCTLGVGDSVRYRYSFRMNDLPDPRAGLRTWQYAFRMPATKPGGSLRCSIEADPFARFEVRHRTITLEAVR